MLNEIFIVHFCCLRAEFTSNDVSVYAKQPPTIQQQVEGKNNIWRGKEKIVTMFVHVGGCACMCVYVCVYMYVSMGTNMIVCVHVLRHTIRTKGYCACAVEIWRCWVSLFAEDKFYWFHALMQVRLERTLCFVPPKKIYYREKWQPYGRREPRNTNQRPQIFWPWNDFLRFKSELFSFFRFSRRRPSRLTSCTGGIEAVL